MKSRLKHLYECYAEYPKDPKDAIGIDATDFESMFAAWADAFNYDGEGETPIYKDKLVWLKVIIQKAYTQGGQTFGTPNFIELYKEGYKPAILRIKPLEESLDIALSSASAPTSLGKGSKLPDPNAAAGLPVFSEFPEQ